MKELKILMYGMSFGGGLMLLILIKPLSESYQKAPNEKDSLRHQKTVLNDTIISPIINH